MKKTIQQIIVSSLIGLAIMTACQPVAGQSAVKTQTAVIISRNAAQLAPAAQARAGSEFNDIVWAADGSALLAISGSGAAKFSAAALEKQETFSFDNPAALYAASPDGKTIVFSNDNYNAFLADIQATENAQSIYSPTYLGNFNFSPDGKTLLSTSLDEIAVTLWDAASGAQVQTISGFETAAPVYSAQFGEDGQHILWIARGTLQLSDIATQDFGPVFSHEDFVSAAALSQDGSLLASAAAGTVNGEFTPAIYLWDASNGELKTTLTYPEAFNAVAFSPDGSLLAASAGSTLVFWKTADGQQIAEIDAGSEDIFGLAFSPDGASLATSGSAGTITLWQVK
jgi:WD40 repeat protein